MRESDGASRGSENQLDSNDATITTMDDATIAIIDDETDAATTTGTTTTGSFTATGTVDKVATGFTGMYRGQYDDHDFTTFAKIFYSKNSCTSTTARKATTGRHHPQHFRDHRDCHPMMGDGDGVAMGDGDGVVTGDMQLTFEPCMNDERRINNVALRPWPVLGPGGVLKHGPCITTNSYSFMYLARLKER